MPKTHSMSGGYFEEIDVEAGFTEDIVTNLGEVLKVAVITWYVRGGTIEQKAKHLGISVNSFKKYIDVAHNRIEDEIKSIKARSSSYPAGVQA